MNTEKEYQLIKMTLKVVKDTNNPIKYDPCMGKEKNQERLDWDKNKQKTITNLKLRMFILNLNLRPTLPIPTELQEIITQKSLMSELNDHKYFKCGNTFDKWIHTAYDYRIPYKQMDKIVSRRTFHGLLQLSDSDIPRKQYYMELAELNGIKVYKSWKVNKMINKLMISI